MLPTRSTVITFATLTLADEPKRYFCNCHTERSRFWNILILITVEVLVLFRGEDVDFTAPGGQFL